MSRRIIHSVRKRRTKNVRLLFALCFSSSRRRRSRGKLFSWSITSRSSFERLRLCSPLLLFVFAIPVLFGNLFHLYACSEHCVHTRLVSSVNAETSLACASIEPASTEQAVVSVTTNERHDEDSCPICRFISLCQTIVPVCERANWNETILERVSAPSQFLSSSARLIRRGRAPPQPF